ncbi:hypothetical protein GGR56DRAFT_161073 [Xylariaceae sp. FL0804]|nr:hypothetical protein GGR56DRAFT_161073 [Xylariaceae sp. FL0804]
MYSQGLGSFYTQSGDIDYDFGCLSDSDFGLDPLRKEARDGAESPFVGFSQRFGSPFTPLRKWAAPKKPSAVNSSVFDFSGFEHRPSTSRAASSRSSSLPASGRFFPDRSNEPPLRPTPALSFYESSNNVAMPSPLDVEKANSVLLSIERERA